MKLRIQYSAQLRTVAGRSEDELDLSEAVNLLELLRRLAADHSREFATHLLTESGEVRPSLLLAVNGTAVSAGAAAATELKTGDVVLLMPPIAGG
jgi:sulfur-carrier protein